jgi:predicted nucleotidyltransferase
MDNAMKIDPGLKQTVSAQPYALLFVTISGAHLYEFPSPDSNFELRGAQLLPLENVDVVVQDQIRISAQPKC